MAARQLQRRLFSILSRHESSIKDPSRHHCWTKSPLFAPFYRRSIQTLVTGGEDAKGEEEEKSTISAVNSSLKTSARHDMAIVFTCKVCETRSVKTACKESYEKGVVVVRCGGCNNLHLIADRLGWFGEPGSVEELLAARGEEIKKGSVDTLSLSPQDLAGLNSIVV